MDLEDFAQAARAASGPVIAVVQAGQVNTGAFDPFRKLIPVARDAGAWVHVDAAFGLWARASAALRHLADGIDQADSWATDGHKWLQTPYDCGYAIVRDEAAHRRATTIAASYLPGAAEGERDPTHYVLELSRRARGFATWAMIKHLGRSGIAEMVERHCRAARAMADRLAADRGVAVLNDVQLNQVLVRFGADAPPEEGDRLTSDTIARIQSDGECFAGGARWRGRQVMRISVSSWATDLQQAVAAADAMLQAWHAVRAERKSSAVTALATWRNELSPMRPSSPAAAFAARSRSRSTIRRSGPGMTTAARAGSRMARSMRPMWGCGASASVSRRESATSRATSDKANGAARSFCKRCGTPLIYERARSRHMINIPRALFESRTGRQPIYHMGIDEAQDWAYGGERLVPLKGYPGVVWTRPKRKRSRESTPS